MYLLFRVWFIKFTHFLLITWCTAWLVFLLRNVPLKTGLKVARQNNSVATPSIFESLILKQIDLYGKTIITHRLNFIMILFSLEMIYAAHTLGSCFPLCEVSQKSIRGISRHLAVSTKRV